MAVDAPKTLRMTRQRQAILDELRRVTSHPTADEVHRAVRRRLPRVSLATVYRNLEILAGRGMVTRLDGGDGRRRYDGDVEAHYHVRCTRCGRVGDVHAGPVELDWRRLADASDFAITGCRIEFAGLCPDCRRNVTTKRGRARKGTGRGR